MFPAHSQRPMVSWSLLAIICAAAAAFMGYAALHEPAIVDEAAHIPAGYAYVHELDFRLNPEHPPLVKAAAALPLLFLQPNFPTDSEAWTKDVNGQWAMGERFLYGADNDANQIVALARIVPILLTLLTVVFVYFWASELTGPAWGLLPAFLLAFSPTVLAHGHYVTTDIGAALGVLLASYYFVKALKEPSPKNTLLAGLALGIAELMKFSAVLLFPYIAILAAAYFFATAAGLRGKYLRQTALRKLGQLAAVGAVAFVLVICPVYALFTVHYPPERQLSDTRTILADFAEAQPAANLQCSGLKHCLANGDMILASNAATRPLAEYFLGVLMVLHRATSGNTAYFLGQVSASGSHSYFPIVYLLKESLPTLIILFAALIGAMWALGRTFFQRQERPRLRTYLKEHFSEFAILLFLAIYWFYSIRSTLNIGVRHLMPVIPLMYLLASVWWRRWIMGAKAVSQGTPLAAIWNAMRSLASSWLKLSLLAALLLWVALETLGAAPYFLSYFNQFGGSTAQGYRYATDSNYDWGQDMLRLRDFVAAHPEIDKIGVDYFGTSGAPAYYLGDKEVNWWSAKGNPADSGVHWLAVSAYTLQNLIQPTAPDFHRAPEDSYPWLTALRPAPPGRGQVPEPDYRVGTTIFIYKLQPDYL